MPVGFGNLTAALQGQIAPGVAQVHYMVDSDFRTIAQGWSRADGTGPLDVWQGRNKTFPYVFRTGDFANDSAAIQAGVDAMVNFRGDILYWTPGAYAPATVVDMDVPNARWLGEAAKSPHHGAPPSVRKTTITAGVGSVFAPVAAADMDNFELAYINLVPFTATSIFAFDQTGTGMYFHDFVWDSLGVTANAGTQCFIDGAIQKECLYDNFTFLTDAVQGPFYEMDSDCQAITISNFLHLHYDTGGTLPISLLDVDATAIDAIQILNGRGIASEVGTGDVTVLVDLAAQAGSVGVLYVMDFRGTTNYSTTGTLVLSTGDLGEAELSQCYDSAIQGGDGGVTNYIGG